MYKIFCKIASHALPPKVLYNSCNTTNTEIQHITTYMFIMDYILFSTPPQNQYLFKINYIVTNDTQHPPLRKKGSKINVRIKIQ